jgi:CRP/FNR family cyclic AMP-dependent transcriptional regulator
VPLFEGLPSDSVDRLLARAVVRTYPRHAVVISEGDKSGSLYAILEGRVKVYLTDTGGKEFVLTTQGAGDYFGELSLLDDAPRSASVAAVEPCRLLVLSKQSFQDCLREHPDLALQIIRGLARRVRRLTESARSLALKDVFGRITTLLQDLAEQGDGLPVVKDRLTHQEIAHRIGASREMVSRIMKDLETGGYIEVDPSNHILIRRKLPRSW